jgi:hypothetical protein
MTGYFGEGAIPPPKLAFFRPPAVFTTPAEDASLTFILLVSVLGEVGAPGVSRRERPLKWLSDKRPLLMSSEARETGWGPTIHQKLIMAKRTRPRIFAAERLLRTNARLRRIVSLKRERFTSTVRFGSVRIFGRFFESDLFLARLARAVCLFAYFKEEEHVHHFPR